MSNQDIHKLSDKELQKMIADERSTLHNLKFQAASGQLKNVRSIRNSRQQIAQLLTELSQRVLSSNQ